MNDKRNILLLYLLDGQIQLQITAVAGDFFGTKIPSTLLEGGVEGGGVGGGLEVDVVVLSTFFERHIF